MALRMEAFDIMSVNFHAFQSRGFLFSNYEVDSQQWQDAFAGYDPSRIARILHLDYDESFLYLSYFGRRYRLRRSLGILEKQEGDSWTDRLYFNETMSIYHLLRYTCDQPEISGAWTPNTDLDGVRARNDRMPDPLLSPFAARFTGHVRELADACERCGGVKLPDVRGDVAYEFTAFPQVKLRLVFWDADEDFPAQAQVLFDKTVTDFIHFETTGCIISDLLEMLEAPEE